MEKFFAFRLQRIEKQTGKKHLKYFCQCTFAYLKSCLKFSERGGATVRVVASQLSGHGFNSSYEKYFLAETLLFQFDSRQTASQ